MNQQLLITLRELRIDIKFVENTNNNIHGLCDSTHCKGMHCDECFLNGGVTYIYEPMERYL